MRDLVPVMMLIAMPGSPLAAAAAEPTPAGLSQCFDQQSRKVPFSGVAAASNGRVHFERSAGFVDGAGKQQASADVPFRLASVQKVLTGVAIGQLVDSGKVALDAPIGNYLNGLPAEIAGVTINQLLHHQSGVASFTLLNPEIAHSLAAAKSARDLVTLVAAQPLAFPPGSKTEYSNGGYYLLGAVIEAVSGQSYGAYLQAHIFAPLRMTNSGVATSARTAVGYSRMSPAGPLPSPRPMTGPKLPATAAGDGVSTANDMLLLGRALVGDSLISKEVKARIFQHRTEPWRIGQSGGSIGTNTDFAVYPESGWVDVVLSNYDPPAGELMGEVLRKVSTGGACQPLGVGDRPSPFKMILKPPSGAPHA